MITKPIVVVVTFKKGEDTFPFDCLTQNYSLFLSLSPFVWGCFRLRVIVDAFEWLKVREPSRENRRERENGGDLNETRTRTHTHRTNTHKHGRIITKTPNNAAVSQIFSRGRRGRDSVV